MNDFSFLKCSLLLFPFTKISKKFSLDKLYYMSPMNPAKIKPVDCLRKYINFINN